MNSLSGLFKSQCKEKRAVRFGTFCDTFHDQVISDNKQNDNEQFQENQITMCVNLWLWYISLSDFAFAAKNLLFPSQA